MFDPPAPTSTAATDGSIVRDFAYPRPGDNEHDNREHEHDDGDDESTRVGASDNRSGSRVTSTRQPTITPTLMRARTTTTTTTTSTVRHLDQTTYSVSGAQEGAIPFKDLFEQMTRTNTLRSIIRKYGPSLYFGRGEEDIGEEDELLRLPITFEASTYQRNTRWLEGVTEKLQVKLRQVGWELDVTTLAVSDIGRPAR